MIGTKLSNLELLVRVLSGLFSQCPRTAIHTAVWCVAWRLGLIGAYAYALKTIVDAYQNRSGDSLIEFNMVLGLGVTIGLFLATAAFDLIYSRKRQQLTIEVRDYFAEVAQSAQIHSLKTPQGSPYSHSATITKCFDAFMGGVLFVLSLMLIAFISLRILIVFLLVLPFFAVVYYVVKRNFSRQIKQQEASKNQAEAANFKLMRSAYFRAVSLLAAGLFVVLICLFFFYQTDVSFSVIQVAILGFSIRFLISFLSLFLMNLANVMDRIDVARYYVSALRAFS